MKNCSDSSELVILEERLGIENDHSPLILPIIFCKKISYEFLPLALPEKSDAATGQAKNKPRLGQRATATAVIFVAIQLSATTTVLDTNNDAATEATHARILIDRLSEVFFIQSE